MITPWGAAQTEKTITKGIVAVTTSTHGGIGVSGEMADRLSRAARAEAIDQDGTYWFEEDCDWAIVAFEFPEYFPKDDPDKVKESLGRWNEAYLLLTASA